jgi:hypothetical protein
LPRRDENPPGHFLNTKDHMKIPIDATPVLKASCPNCKSRNTISFESKGEYQIVCFDEAGSDDAPVVYETMPPFAAPTSFIVPETA